MCEPMTIMAMAGGAQFALQAGGMWMQAQGAADEAERVNQEANATLRREYADLQARRIQENKAAYQEKDRVAREARSKISTAGVAAAEGGASGADVITNLLGQSGRSVFAVDQNLAFTHDQLTRQGEGLKAKAQSRTNAAKANVPTGLELGINIASAAVDSASSAYATGSSLKP